jgi:hypothetical protein
VKLKDNLLSDTHKKPSSVNYQSGMQVRPQAVNSGQVQAGFAQDSQYRPQQQSESGQRGVQDLQKSMQYNAQSQMQRGFEAQNAQKNMQDQAMRSELTQQGLANQAKIYGDINQRAVDQMGLAAKLQEAQIRNNFSVANQQAARLKAMTGGPFSIGGANTFLRGLLQ